MTKATTTMRRCVLALMLGCAACAAGGTGGGSGGSGALTQEDLAAANETNPYLAVQRLRPNWLRARGQSSASGRTVVTLFVDGTPRGDVSSLSSLAIQDIASITYYNASDAAFRFGTIAGNGGTVAVSTRR